MQFGWPVGMPRVRKLGMDLWEIRVRLKDRSARLLLTMHDEELVLLHAFMKKSQKTPLPDLALAEARSSLVHGRRIT